MSKNNETQKEWMSLIKYYGMLPISIYFKDYETYKIIREDVSYKELFNEIAFLESEL